MERTQLDRWWKEEFIPGSGPRELDYVSRDRTTIIEVKESPQGLRGLYSGVMQLALAVEKEPAVEQACLVIYVEGLSLERLKTEWQCILRSFKQRVADRLSLI